MRYEEVVKDFAERTIKNLLEIEKLERSGADVYETTQLINSCLGLLIFPQQEYLNKIPKIPLSELEQDGWPIPSVIGGYRQVENLHQLMRHLRNAISHFNLRFIYSHDNISALEVWNESRNNVTWKAQLNISELRQLVEKFSQQLTHYSTSLTRE